MPLQQPLQQQQRHRHIIATANRTSINKPITPATHIPASVIVQRPTSSVETSHFEKNGTQLHTVPSLQPLNVQKEALTVALSNRNAIIRESIYTCNLSFFLKGSVSYI